MSSTIPVHEIFFWTLYIIAVYTSESPRNLGSMQKWKKTIFKVCRMMINKLILMSGQHSFPQYDIVRIKASSQHYLTHFCSLEVRTTSE